MPHAIHILAAVAQHEPKMISERTKAELMPTASLSRSTRGECETIELGLRYRSESLTLGALACPCFRSCAGPYWGPLVPVRPVEPAVVESPRAVAVR